MQVSSFVLIGFSLTVLGICYLLASYFAFHVFGHVMVDGITTSAVIVTVLSVVFSIVSWFLFSWATRSINTNGVMLSVIVGFVLIAPFNGGFGPTAAILVGLVAGFAAYNFQKKITAPKNNKPLIIGIIAIVTSYAVLFLVIISVQPAFHSWDTGFYIGGGSLDLDPDLSPSYAFDFIGGLFFTVFLIYMSWSVGVLALFLVPYFILKRKNIPSRPYLALILAGLLIFFATPNFISSLQVFAIILSQPQQAATWLFNFKFILLLAPIFILVFAGFLLYNSSVVRKLIK